MVSYPKHLLAVAAMLAGAVTAPAQFNLNEVREALRADLRGGSFAHFVAGIINITTLPDISASRFVVDDASRTEVTTFKLPFERDMLDLSGDAALFLEGNIGYLRTKSTLDDITGGSNPALATRIEARFEVLSGLLGAGVRIPLAEGLSFSPILDAGFANVDSVADYSGPGATTIGPALNGIAFNWFATLFNASANARLTYERDLGDDFDLELHSRYTHSHSWTIDSTDSAQHFNVASDIVVTRGDLIGPTGLDVFEAPLRWRVFAAHNWFPGDTGDALGFRYYNEFGVALESEVSPLGLPIDLVRISGSYFRSPDVAGWSVGLGFSLSF